MSRSRGEPPTIHGLELEVMDELWAAREPLPVRSVRERLNARSEKQRAYTTVMTTLVRLDGKGLVARERRGLADFYVPLVTREAYRQARATAQVEALVDEFGDLALVHFARAMAQLDPGRRAELRRLAGGA